MIDSCPAALRFAAGIVIFKVVSLRKLATAVTLCILTTDVCKNPDPVRVMTVSGEPTKMLLGDRWVMTGKGFVGSGAGITGALLTVNERAADVPPPGAGLTTTICSVPAFAN